MGIMLKMRSGHVSGALSTRLRSVDFPRQWGDTAASEQVRDMPVVYCGAMQHVPSSSVWDLQSGKTDIIFSIE